MNDSPMPDPMADMAPADLEDARVAAHGIMARLLACEAKIAAVADRQRAMDEKLERVRRDVARVEADGGSDF
jgi:hypothetical protein